MKLIIASNNAHKVREIRQILGGVFTDMHTLQEAGLSIEVVEDGATFVENAVKKAEEVLAAAPGYDAALADDSGLIVDALGGARQDKLVVVVRHGGSDVLKGVIAELALLTPAPNGGLLCHAHSFGSVHPIHPIAAMEVLLARCASTVNPTVHRNVASVTLRIGNDIRRAGSDGTTD